MRIQAHEPLISIDYAADKREYLTRGSDAKNPFDSGLVRSSKWCVLADKKEVMVYDTPVTRGGPQSFAIISAGTRHICATYHGPVRSAKILPEELGIEVDITENSISFSVSKERNLLLEVNDTYRFPLAIFVAPPRSSAPDPNDDNVLWFEPGIHRLQNIKLHRNQTLYLEEGAVIIPEAPAADAEVLVQKDWAGKVNYQDFIYAIGKDNIRICGSGIIDTTSLDWHARRSVVFTDCTNVTVSDIILIGAAHWTLPFFGCKDVHIDGVRMLAYRENSDGIDLVDTQNALVEDCFIRTGDDAICLKSMALTPRLGTHDILVRNCQIWNDKVRALGVAGETRCDVSNAIFEKCCVLHSFADWTTEVGAIGVYICDAATVHNITFRDITVRQESNYAICVCIVKDKWSTDQNPGHIKHIRFENIKLPQNSAIFLSGYNEEHRLEDIYFSNCHPNKTGNDISLAEYIDCNVFANVSYE